MLRRLVLVLLLGGAGLGMTTPAYAGPVVIALEQLPAEVHAGDPFTVEFVVITHRDQGSLGPMAGLHPSVLATQGDARVQVTAAAAATPGHYQATLTLPSPGVWTWRISAFGEPEGYVLTPLQVGAPPGAPGLDAATTQPAVGMGWVRGALRGAGVLLLLVALVLPLVRPRQRSQRRPAEPV